MKILVITVAGISSRFSQSVGYDCLKCLYYEDTAEHTLLYHLLSSNMDYCDKVVIVGGFQYEVLSKSLNKWFYLPNKQITEKDIILVKNEHYADYGSGYSLLLGLKKAFELGADEILFAEGDLYVKSESFKQIWEAKKDVVTESCEPILASKAVVFYSDQDGYIHYLYDTKHGTLQIQEPFAAIRNSGQIWKFIDIHKLEEICRGLSDEEQQGTNLIIIQKYFAIRPEKEYERITLPEWINCNTIKDYQLIRKKEENAG